MRMDIVACTDKWFVMPTGVMMQSVCMNNQETEIVFHVVLDDNVTAKDRQDLLDIVASYIEKSVVFYDVNKEMQDRIFPAGRFRSDITKTTYYRLFLAELLPHEIDKVLYLDGDLIVRHSLLPLWNIDFGENAVAAVNDCSSGLIDYYNRLKYPYDLGYFNAGVLLVNLKYWREHYVLRDFIAYMEKHAESIRCHDQDILNAVFCDKKVFVPLKYNLQHSFLWKNNQEYDYWKYEREVLEARWDPTIVHYTNDKPWYKYQRCPHPFRSTWDKYQNQTKWRGMKVEKRPMKLRIINFVADIIRKKGIIPISNDSKCDYIDITPID